MDILPFMDHFIYKRQDFFDIIFIGPLQVLTSARLTSNNIDCSY